MTFRLSPTMTAALRAGKSPVAPLVEVLLPGYPLRHLVGAGEVLFGGNIFRGRDARFGVLKAAGNIKDGTSNEAPDWPLTFSPPDASAAAELAAAEHQDAVVNGWLGVIDRATGHLLPEPLQVFAGTLDVARLRVGKGDRTVEWRAVSSLELFHDEETGARLSDAWHKLIWPGETGLANMTGIERTSYWGVEKPPSGVTYGTGGAAGLGGGLFSRQLGL